MYLSLSLYIYIYICDDDSFIVNNNDNISFYVHIDRYV